MRELSRKERYLLHCLEDIQSPTVFCLAMVVVAVIGGFVIPAASPLLIILGVLLVVMSCALILLTLTSVRLYRRLDRTVLCEHDQEYVERIERLLRNGKLFH